LSKPILKDPRIQRNESVPEVYIVPKASGADALVVRDTLDVINRVKLAEDGKAYLKGATGASAVLSLQHGDRTDWATVISDPYGSMWLDAPTAIRLGKSAYIMGDLKMSGSTRRISGEGSGCYLLTGWDPDLHRLDFYASLTDGTSPVLVGSLRDQYLEIARGKLTDHLTIPASYNILGRSFSGTAKTVTETTETLKDSATPVSPKNVFMPMSIYVTTTNPSGSTVTLVVSIRLAFSDGTETTLESFTVLEGTNITKEYDTHTIAKKLKDGISVTGVRLYAYVSATPVAGYEPSVELTRVSAFQF